jgi:hypothetical protein
MTTKAVQYASDPIHTQAAALGTALEKLVPGSVPQTAESTVARVRKFSARLLDLLAIVDPELLDFAPVQQASQHMVAIPGWIDAYSAGGDNSPSIDQHLDVAVRVLPALVAASPLLGNGKPSALISAVRKETEGLVHGIRLEVEGVRKLVAETVAAGDVVKTEHAALDAKNQQIEEANQRAVAEFRSLLETEKVAAFDRFRTESDQKLADVEASSKEQIHNADAVAKGQYAAAQEILSGLRVLDEEVRQTAATVADRVLAGDYGEHAESERATADRLRYAAGASFALGAVFAVWASLGAASDPGITWQRLVAKLATTVVFTGLGGYLASQSAEHRNEERRVRRRFLDLKGLGPFIAQLPPEKQASIRDELSLRAFFEPEPAPVPRPPRRGLSVDDAGKLFAMAREVKKS